jgi:hypothetical protein
VAINSKGIAEYGGGEGEREKITIPEYLTLKTATVGIYSALTPFCGKSETQKLNIQYV